MIHNEKRVGRATSSEIWRIMKEGKANGSFSTQANSYSMEIKLERKLGRSIETETQAKPLTWGKLLEPFAFNQLGTEYTLCSDATIVHQDLPDLWSGSPDAVKGPDGGRTVCDLKCPQTLMSFCQLVDPLLTMTGIDAMNKIRDTHQDGDKFYWQLCSNAILARAKFAELIIFAPYQDELEAIRESIQQMPAGEMKKYAWVNFADDDELPYLIRGVGKYKSLNVLNFEVPQADKSAMVDRVLRAKREFNL